MWINYLYRMRKVLSFTPAVFLLYVVILLSGCGKEIDYRTIGIECQNYDNSGAFIEASNAAIPRNAYVLRLFYASDLADYQTVNDNNKYVGVNSATSISVRTLQNFDSTHAAGSDISDYFINGPGTTSIQYVIDNFMDTPKWSPNHEADDLWLMHPPANAGTYAFEVKMMFDDGQLFSDTTTVNLN